MTRFAIVGAGLNGSLLALAAGEAGLSTALIDRVPLKSFTDAAFPFEFRFVTPRAAAGKNSFRLRARVRHRR